MTDRRVPQEPDAIVELDVLDQPYGPDAIARLDGMAVFVSDAVPGDRVRARITEVHPRYARARAEEVLVPSEHRVPFQCPVADACGGCQWQAMTYARQLAAKERAVRDALVRIGGWKEPEVRAILPSPEIWRYRNKARYSVEAEMGLFEAGYYARQSRNLVPIRQCPLNLPGLDAALATAIGLLADEPRWWPVAGRLHALVGRQSAGSGEIILRLILKERAEVRPFAEALAGACEGVVGVLANMVGVHRQDKDRVLWGQGFLTEHVGKWRYRVSGAAFFQINPYATPALVELVREAAGLTGRESLVDAYGGVGLFSIALADQAERVTLVEADSVAVADARRMFRQLGLTNAVVHEGPVEQFAERAAGADVIVCDPPRDGAGREGLRALEAQNAGRFVYIACDPTSLARDSVRLRQSGYRLSWARPADLFPHTYHVETVALFERQ